MKGITMEVLCRLDGVNEGDLNGGAAPAGWSE